MLDEAAVNFAAKISPFYSKTFFQTSDQSMNWQIYFPHPQNLICKYNIPPETQAAIASDWNSVREIRLYESLFCIIKWNARIT